MKISKDTYKVLKFTINRRILTQILMNILELCFGGGFYIKRVEKILMNKKGKVLRQKTSCFKN